MFPGRFRFPTRVRTNCRAYTSGHSHPRSTQRNTPYTSAKGNGPGWTDPRPPWVYRTTGMLQYTVIPFALFYAVFFFDFGEREHVFMPPRRWVARQKAAFFTLSPAEEDMLRRAEEHRNGSGSQPTPPSS
ncbi:hypothetical protein PLICRDRAFT_136881 [Plicaturopsis crispa FD-325 SS-3]|nr:hypothetical protein PLICRDRAFT_136881 [Plicaturopsis crispa FD-325 SS-3]